MFHATYLATLLRHKSQQKLPSATYRDSNLSRSFLLLTQALQKVKLDSIFLQGWGNAFIDFFSVAFGGMFPRTICLSSLLSLLIMTQTPHFHALSHGNRWTAGSTVITAINLSKWLRHPLGATRHVITGLHCGRLGPRAEPGVDIIFHAVGRHLNALDFPRSVAAVACAGAVLPALCFPT